MVEILKFCIVCLTIIEVPNTQVRLFVAKLILRMREVDRLG